MLIIRVVQDHHGWSIRSGEGVKAPFRSKKMAALKADMLAGALRRHGVATRVIVENEALTACATGVELAYAEPSKVATLRSDASQRGFLSSTPNR